ncbi:hypothetical protein [Jannaschia sp. R86511]|uniref:hypothetical protein n=1 Tax=Jannaschia sp. R86511 TaxID=3093853 RepID=UPI0036D40033
MTRHAHARTAALGAAVLLGLAGCGYDITGKPTGETTVRDSTDRAAPATGGASTAPTVAPSTATDAPAEQAWALADLTPPADAEVVSSVQRPNEQDVASYLVVSTTTPEAAAALCDQLGGLLPTLGAPLSDRQRAPFELTEDPEGELGLCFGAVDGAERAVQRDVLVAESGGTATVWLSVYEMPR